MFEKLIQKYEGLSINQFTLGLIILYSATAMATWALLALVGQKVVLSLCLVGFLAVLGVLVWHFVTQYERGGTIKGR